MRIILKYTLVEDGVGAGMFQLAQFRVQRISFVITVMSLRAPKKLGIPKSDK
jgi:hypothetical protein